MEAWCSNGPAVENNSSIFTVELLFCAKCCFTTAFLSVRFLKVHLVISFTDEETEAKKSYMSCSSVNNKISGVLIFEFSSSRLQSPGTRTSLTAPSLCPLQSTPAGPGAALLWADEPSGVSTGAFCPLRMLGWWAAMSHLSGGPCSLNVF